MQVSGTVVWIFAILDNWGLEFLQVVWEVISAFRFISVL